MSTVEITDKGRVRWLCIARPERKNALDFATLTSLAAGIRAADEAAEVRCIVVTGKGPSFCSGADLKAAAEQMGSGEGLEIGTVLRERYHPVIRALWHSQTPVIARVPGPAVGFGCDIALACDLRIGSPAASFAEVFPRIGLQPDGGGTFLLPRIVGLGRALELILTAEKVDAARAEAIGLLNRVVPEAELDAAVQATAERIAGLAPLALARSRRSVYDNLSAGIDAALEREARHQTALGKSSDVMMGMMSFLMKQKPEFEGK